MRKILGTEKFVIYFFNAKSVRGGSSKPKHFVYKQMGRIYKVDENNKQIGKALPFSDYGKMITIINNILRKKVQKNLKEKKIWN